MRSSRGWAVAALATILALAVLVFRPGLHGGFLFDDYVNIVDNKELVLHAFSGTELLRAAMASEAASMHRPLANLSFALDMARAGLDPQAMKATNLGIHLLNIVFVFALLMQLWALPSTAASESRHPGAATACAALCALAWALAPINLTPVLYIVQRMESLANLFVVAGLCLYLSGRKAQIAGRGGWPRVLAGLVFGTGLGLLGKETAALLPLYAVVLEWAVLRWQAARPSDSAWLRRGSVAILACGALGACLLVWQEAISGAWQFRTFTLPQRELTEARILLDYVRWTLFPSLKAMGFYYDDYPVSTGLLAPASTLLSIAVLAALAVVGVLLRARIPLACLGIAWFFAGHSLTAAPIPLELVFEHRNYFPSLGLILAVVACGRRMVDRVGMPAVFATAALAWIAFLGTTTYLRATEWSSPLRLAESLAAKQPGSPRTQYELGRDYLVLSNYDPRSKYTALSRDTFERAARIPGASPLAEQALLIQSARLGLPAKDAWWEGLRHKLTLHEPGPQEVVSLYAISHCAVAGLCRFPPSRVIDLYLAALQYPAPSLELMASYADYSANVLGDFALGVKLMRDAVARDPANLRYRQNLIYLLYKSGDTASATREYANYRARIGDARAREWAKVSLPQMLQTAH